MATFTSTDAPPPGQEDQFLKAGYIVVPTEDMPALDRIRLTTAMAAAEIIGVPVPNDLGAFLDGIHSQVTVNDLNEFRLAVLAKLSASPTFRADYFSCARSLVQAIVGTELAMQRSIGLSVQLPNDSSSLLPLHSDTWGSECSPFEVVLWIPLVDCARTKSMFLLAPEIDRRWRSRIGEFEKSGTEALFKAVEPDLSWTEIKYGQVMLFTPTVMHGNRVNLESTTRWSFNVRFKGLFTPYANKKLGDYFIPLSITPASRVGLSFEMPTIGEA